MQNKLTLKNYHVNVLGRWLNNLALPGSQSRARTRFVTILADKSKLIEDGRLSLVEKYAEKGEDGKPKEIEVNGLKKFDMSPDNEAAFKKDYADFLAEECIIDILPSNEETIKKIHDVVLNTDKEIKDEYVKNEAGEVVEVIGWSSLYSEWCDALDAALA